MRNLSFRYYKRYRMELDLRGWRRPALAVRPEYRLTPWSPPLVYEHAEVKYLSFRETIDAVVFPCLGELSTCLRLMEEIRDRAGFLPEATWLAAHVGPDGSFRESCGTIQAIRGARGRANIQNIGVTPSHRGRGIGAGLILAACSGLQQVGVSKALLEVTAENEPAVRLYRRLGFRVVRTLYKAVDRTFSAAAAPAAGCR